MYFTNPPGAWALLGLLVILLLYLLKQRMEPQTVSSTLLWRKALVSWEASHPFQRLRKNLLLWLQLLAVCLLALALMRPVLHRLGDAPPIFVFDLSASMQADGRLERAKADAVARVEALKADTPVTVITAGAQVRTLASQSTDRRATLATLRELEAENGGADMAQALSLATSIAQEVDGARIVAYSDTDRSEPSASYPSVGGGVDNSALLSLAASGEKAVARVANYGQARTLTLSCEADGRLCDLRTVDLEAEQIASVYFDIPAGTQTLIAHIDEGDALLADNTRYWIAPLSGVTRALMAGRGNLFLEKALGLRDDLLLNKTTLEEAAVLTGFSLTVLDGPLPQVLPAQGAILAVDPDRAVFNVAPLDPVEQAATLRVAPNETARAWTEHMDANQIHVARYRPLEGDGLPILYAGDAAVVLLTEQEGRRAVVFGFDLHNSNLPMLKEFPLLLRRILAWLAPEPLAGGQEAACGEVMILPWPALAARMTVITPSGRSVALSSERFADTQEIGVHHLIQTDLEDVETISSFALHMPAAESDVRYAAQARMLEGIEAAAQGSFQWTWLIVLLLIGLMLTEWWVYRRGFGV